MKRRMIETALLTAHVLSTAVWIAVAPAAHVEIVYDPGTTIRLGGIPAGNRDVVVRCGNRGRDPVVLARVSSSCGCTIPKFTPTTIMPGDWCSVPLAITAFPNVTKVVVVGFEFSAPAAFREAVTLEFRGMSRGSLLPMERQALLQSDVMGNISATVSATYAAAQPDDSLPDGSWRVSPEGYFEITNISARRIDEKRVEYACAVRVVDVASYGDTGAWATLRIGSPVVAETRIMIAPFRGRRLTVRPRAVVLDSVTARSKSVSMSYPPEWKRPTVEKSPSWLATELSEDPPRLTVRLASDVPVGLLSGIVEVQAQDDRGRRQSVQLQVAGDVR